MTFYIKSSVGADEYHFALVKKMSTSQRKPVTSLPITGSTAENSIQLGIEGESIDIAITWIITNNNVDKANGSYSSTVKTVAEQLNYLQNVIFASTIGIQLSLYTDRLSALPVIYESFEIDEDASTPLATEVTVRLKVGTAI